MSDEPPPTPVAFVRSPSLAPASHDNPTPQSWGPPTSYATKSDKIVCIMVGLPARGKSYISRRLAHYVSFFYGAPAKVFNVGDYRRKIARTTSMADFFDSSNQAAMKARAQACEEALTDLKRWIGETPSQQQRLDQKLHQSGDFGSLAIFDATNSTQSRRAWLVEQLKDTGAKVIFIESVCRDERLVQQNILHAKESVLARLEPRRTAGLVDRPAPLVGWESRLRGCRPGRRHRRLRGADTALRAGEGPRGSRPAHGPAPRISLSLGSSRSVSDRCIRSSARPRSTSPGSRSSMAAASSR